jgi:S-adenosylmethionine/arginine decarboxylase-like enzyme
MNYGKELILDLHDCDTNKFNRLDIEYFCKKLCSLLNVEPCDLHFWDDVGVSEEEKQTEPHLKGTTAIQFLTTSNITIHTLDILERVYLNVFVCGQFDTQIVVDFALKWFKGRIVHRESIDRY